MLQYQGMVVLAGSQVWWTWEVEDVFEKVRKGDKMAMKNYAKKMHRQIDDLVVKVTAYNSKYLCLICMFHLLFITAPSTRLLDFKNLEIINIHVVTINRSYHSIHE